MSDNTVGKNAGSEASTVKQPAILGTAKVEHIPLDKLDLADVSYMFRASLRTGPLKHSIASEGQQMPIVVRRKGDGYQVISGFRRANAMKDLKASTIAAILREDLDDDEDAFRASVLENSQRKTYSDIDRAIVIQKYEERGFTGAAIAEVMGLKERQIRNLKRLLDLPETVRKAIGDPDSKFTATHAITLKALKGKYPALNYGKWVKAVNEGNDGQGLSVAQMQRAVNKEYRSGKSEERLGSIFRTDGTDTEKGVWRLQPVKVELEKLSDEDKAQLRGELQWLLDRLA